MLVGRNYRGKGRAVIGLDWTFSHHNRGPHSFGVKEGYDYVNKCPGRFQTVLTATVANTERLDGIEVKIQHPLALAKEKAYLKQTSTKDYDTLAAAHARLLELVHYALHCKRYQKITEMAVDVVKQIEQEHHFPDANYAFDNGLLCLGLVREIEQQGKYWVSGLEVSRHVHWKDAWRRIDEVAQHLRTSSPKSFRRIEFQTRVGETKTCWV